MTNINVLRIETEWSIATKCIVIQLIWIIKKKVTKNIHIHTYTSKKYFANYSRSNEEIKSHNADIDNCHKMMGALC